MKDVKKYSLSEIRIRLNNLKKKRGSYAVEKEIDFSRKYTDNELDVLNLAYRTLKNRYTKIHRYKFGYVRTIGFEIKKRPTINYFKSIPTYASDFITYTTNAYSTWMTNTYVW